VRIFNVGMGGNVRICRCANLRMMGMCESAVECMMGLIVQNDMGFSRS
jgi:hypothetical protein